MDTTRRASPRQAGSIRARVLRIALVPCGVALVFGLSLSGYLAYQGERSLGFATVHKDGLPITGGNIQALSEERALTLAVQAGDVAQRAQLTEARNRVNTALDELLAYGHRLAAYAPEMAPQVAAGEQGKADILQLRKRIDSGEVDAVTAFGFYNRMFDLIGTASKRLAIVANDASVGFEHVVASEMFSVVESVSRAHALAGYLRVSPDPAVQAQVAGLFAQYHQPPSAIVASLTEGERGRLAQLMKSREWATLVGGDNALLASKSFDVAAWNQAANAVRQELSGIYLSHAAHTSDLAEDAGRSALVWSILGAVVVALAAGLVALLTYRSASRLIGRLTALRQQTLDVAERVLPELIVEVGAAKRIDPANAVPRLDFGTDEIGEVAQAFNTAQRAAVSAAVAEAETRHGVRAVFLNIAHRSQALVHRQLKELDQIERSEDNPDLLDRLFRLDHLTTRNRRNAENLIILGGKPVGRQWRHPVGLHDVVFGAVSETRHYTRVVTDEIPDVVVDGSAVADVGHLVAELVDNGTAFSPPESKVRVRANVVGKGVAIEVEDQGLGIDRAQLDELNELLREPPDFSFMALAGEAGIGLFVVATLAAKHRVRVTLRESAYGGILAIAVLPSSVLAAPPETGSPQPVFPERTDRFAVPGVQNGNARNGNSIDDLPMSVLRPGTNGAEPAASVVSEHPQPDDDNAASGAASAPTANRGWPPAPDEETAPPPLPRRVRQDSLTPQLRDEPSAITRPSNVDDPDAAAERSRVALTAFQRGTVRARNEAGHDPAIPVEGR